MTIGSFKSLVGVPFRERCGARSRPEGRSYNTGNERGLGAPKRSEGGFLLLEVLMAVLLMAIAFGVLLEALGRCVAAARSVQSYSTAQTLLANKSYEFRVERPTDYLDQNGTFADYPGFEWSRTLEGTEAEGLWKQVITVQWEERGKPATDSVVEYRYFPQKVR